MKRFYLFALALLLVNAPLQAAVIEASKDGFLVRHELEINGSAERTYQLLLHPESWWNPVHTYSGDSHQLSLDARAGGCFCEQLANGGSVQHMQVLMLLPNKMLRMGGALGPLQGSGLAGSLSWEVSAAGNGSKLKLSYSVGGFMAGGVDSMAGAVDHVLGEQAARLKQAVEQTTK
jgi:hypothetical protein